VDTASTKHQECLAGEHIAFRPSCLCSHAPTLTTQYYYLGEIFYFASITANKLSLLLFMLRVFPDRRFRMLVYAVGGLVIAYGISFIVATAFQCSPVEWSWQQIDDEWGTGTCNNISMQGWLSAIINIVIDIIMLVLPLKNLWNLQMQLKKKLMIMFMFSLGVL
jgi:hypothetical protein